MKYLIFLFAIYILFQPNIVCLPVQRGVKQLESSSMTIKDWLDGHNRQVFVKHIQRLILVIIYKALPVIPPPPPPSPLPPPPCSPTYPTCSLPPIPIPIPTPLPTPWCPSSPTGLPFPTPPYCPPF